MLKFTMTMSGAQSAMTSLITMRPRLFAACWDSSKDLPSLITVRPRLFAHAGTQVRLNLV